MLVDLMYIAVMAGRASMLELPFGSGPVRKWQGTDVGFAHVFGLELGQCIHMVRP